MERREVHKPFFFDTFDKSMEKTSDGKLGVEMENPNKSPFMKRELMVEKKKKGGVGKN